MHSDDPDISKSKRVRTDFYNLVLLTKSTTPGEVQATYAHVSIGNKPLGKKVTTFALAGSPKTPTMVSINIERAFAEDSKKICPARMEVLFCAATGELAKSKKLGDWTARKAILLPSFLTEIALTDRETTAEALLKIFAEKINKQEAENAADVDLCVHYT